MALVLIVGLACADESVTEAPQSEGSPAAQQPSEADRTSIEDTVTAYFAAATPQDACANMTAGLASAITRKDVSGDPEALLTIPVRPA